jgi:hypothetical protein
VRLPSRASTGWVSPPVTSRSAPYLTFDRMVDSPSGRREFMAKLDNHSISISALNCSGNPLYPGVIGERHCQVTRKTVVLAGLI